jgi:hypothetical protein
MVSIYYRLCLYFQLGDAFKSKEVLRVEYTEDVGDEAGAEAGVVEVVELASSSEDEDDDAVVLPQSFAERGARQLLYHMSAAAELQQQNVSEEVVMGMIDPNNLEHVPSAVGGPEIDVIEHVSGDEKMIIDEASKLLSSAADLSMNAHKLLSQAEEMRANAYVMLEEVSGNPMVQLLLQADQGQLPDGIETGMSLKQLKRKVVSEQGDKGKMGKGSSGKVTPTKVVPSKKGKADTVTTKQGNKGRRLSTGSVVSVGPPIQGKVVPDDYPDTWPLKYRPLHVGGGPNESRVYLCQFPKCTKSITKLDPAWRHLAVDHMNSEAKCHLCTATYTHPGSMRAHLRKH